MHILINAHPHRYTYRQDSKAQSQLQVPRERRMYRVYILLSLARSSPPTQRNAGEDRGTIVTIGHLIVAWDCLASKRFGS
jgi:hypothetical protein